jgi:hypothetical protein
VKRMQKRCKSGINCDVDVDDLDEVEKKKQEKEMKVLSAYAKLLHKGTTSSIVQMVGDEDNIWEKCESQNMHRRFVNTRRYKRIV